MNEWSSPDLDMTEIVSHLWMGGYPHPDGNYAGAGITAVVNVDHKELGSSQGRRPWWPPIWPGLYVHYPLSDGDGDSQFDTRRVWNTVRSISQFVAKLVLHDDHTVLVHCTQGWNRSGIIVARALIDMGKSPEEAIALVQRRRNPECLSNPHFTRWLMLEGPSLQRDLAIAEGSLVPD
jgi:hypothetical protein